MSPRELPDIVATWECFGRSVPRDDPARELRRGYAQPLILVSPKVYQLLTKLKIRDAAFQPTAFV
jgi:hypothetical protein